jgi:ribonuclease P protein component
MLPKSNRLTKDKDFSQVFKKGKSVWGKRIGIRIFKTDLPSSRFGFVVSNKVSKKATVRNKIKRRLRQLVRLNLDQIEPGYDVVIVVSPKAVNLDFQELGEEMENCFKKIRLMKR